MLVTNDANMIPGIFDCVTPWNTAAMARHDSIHAHSAAARS